jgi:carbon-monoxide dehydrogenase medium subunit
MAGTESDGVYRKPDTLPEAKDALAEHAPSVKVVSGGQSLSLLIRQDLLSPDALVDIADLPALNGVERRSDEIAIGATTTYAELEESDLIDGFGGLTDAVHVIAGPQVRNMGTVGGAVSHADPSLDVVPPLLCLDATVRIGSVDGTRTVPLREFHSEYMNASIEPDEIVESITFEPGSETQGSAYTKHSNAEGGWATVGVGATVDLSPDGERFESARVALAAVADTAVRAPTVEEALEGEQLDEDTIEAAAQGVREDIDPIGDHSGTAEYKRDLAGELTGRILTEAAGRAGGAL